MSNNYHQVVHAMLHNAHQADKGGNHKLAGVVYIVVGFFLTPALIGFPLIAYGVYLLFK